MLVCIGQKCGTDHDWEKAETLIKESLWRDVELIKAGSLTPESVKDKD
jgi:hypothetical protein